jgi:hypothetical protein
LTFSDYGGYGEVMHRERHALVWLCLGGCSLFVKFDDKDVPKDAPPDSFMPFSAAECAFGEPNDSPGSAFPINPGDTGPAAICPNPDLTVTDLDYYAITVPDGTASVAMGIQFMSRTDGDLDLILYDAAGSSIIGQSRGFGDSEMLVCPGLSPVCPALPAGSYVMEVLPGESGDFNDYTFSLAITAGSGSGSGSGSG